MKIVENFCQWRPRSQFARTLTRCFRYDAYTEDIGHLSPWVTWPTLHRGVVNEKHRIHDFGQDLTEVDRAYPTIWQILAANGIDVGVCGSLHTYPMPGDLENYRFYIPDAFAAGSECFPENIAAFQDFNLKLSRASARNVSMQVPWGAALRFLRNAPGLGIKPRTALDVGLQLVSERMRRWQRVRRRTFQTVLAFDIYMKALKRTKPSFSTFFTNHVASSMHRYWAAAFPGDYEEFGYTDEWVNTYRGEIDYTMHKFDQWFKRLVDFADKNPEYQIWVATSMGQAATRAEPLETQLYVIDQNRFMEKMGIDSDEWTELPAMLPQYSYRITDQKVAAFRENLEQIGVNGKPIRFAEDVSGFFNVHFGHRNVHKDSNCLTFRGERLAFEELGVQPVEIEDMSDASAYHIPEGCLFIYDPSKSAEGIDATTISSIDLAPTILKNFSVDIPSYMKAPATLVS